MSEHSFDDIDDLQRKPEIEGKEGTLVEFPGGRWIRVLAASDNNPKWVARRKAIAAGTRRLAGAEANDARYRAFIVPFFAEALVIGWGGWKSKGVELPYTPAACVALLLKADDVYAALSATVYDDKKFRGDKIEVVIAEAGE